MRTRIAMAGLAVAYLATIGQATAQQPEQPPLEINEPKKESPPLTPTERTRVAAEAQRLSAEALQFFNQKDFAGAAEKQKQAFSREQKLYPAKDYPQGHAELAQCLNLVGFFLQANRKYGEALPYFDQALAMRQRLYPKSRFPQGHPDIALTLGTMGVLQYQQGKYRQATPYLEQSLAMQQQLYPEARYPKGHPQIASILNLLGLIQDAQGDYGKALRYFEQALAMRQRLYPKSSYPDGNAELANSLNSVGTTLAKRGEYGKALDFFKQGLTMFQQLYPKARYPEGHTLLANSLNSVGAVLKVMGEYGKAEPYYEQALAMRQQLYPKNLFPHGDPELAHSLNNMGFLLQSQGEYGRALPYVEQALAMFQELYPPTRFPQGHPDLASSLGSMGAVLLKQGEHGKARHFFEKALAMGRQFYDPARYPQGHPDLSTYLNNLGFLLIAQGEYEKALPYFEQSLAVDKRFYPESRYPQGHPDLAIGLNNLGGMLKAHGEYGKALVYHEKAVEMLKQLYPKARYPLGHPELALGLNNVGSSLQAMGRYGKALDYHMQALDMRQQLYPKKRYTQGHPDLTESLNNLGAVLLAQGEYAEALSYYEQALAMKRQLYPKARYPLGHSDLAVSLGNLSSLLQAKRDYAGALPYAEQSLNMDRGLDERFIAGAPEAEALVFLHRHPSMSDGYLFVTGNTATPADRTYGQVWQSRALLTRLLQRRHQATRIALAGSNEARQKWGNLLDARRHLARLILQPGQDRAAWEDELARITDRKENLERDLARLLPELARARELDQLGPRDLAAVLPPAAAFVDLLRYTHRDTGGQFTASYVAFVVLPDSSILRVDLQNAGSIDKAVENWRQAISTYQDTPAEAALVARLVWEPLARKLPSGTTTVFLALDGAMVRVPWAALPGSKPGTVLLEELAVVVVPHGPFLLEQLKYPTHIAAGKENVLALGDVDYGPAKQDGYKPLAGTAAEVRQMFAVAGTRIKQELTRERATWAGLKEALPQARYAHLATHGFFNAGALVQEHQRMERQLKTWEFQEDRQTQRLGMGRRSPLSYTGLVLAGANLPAQAQDGGIVTGEALVELPLEGLRLCVLSACESGVGSLTAVAGEGVQGLPRAFHLAGCPNVISSLWNVNDKATAALMARFYHELWVGGKTPLEALRQAQLTILRHPERIDDLADRGRPNFSRLVAAPPDLHAPPGQPAPKRARTKLWAAFMLSGVGR